MVYLRNHTTSRVSTSRRTKTSGHQPPSNNPSIIDHNIRPPFSCSALLGAALWLRPLAVGGVRLPRARGTNLSLGIPKVLSEF